MINKVNIGYSHIDNKLIKGIIYISCFVREITYFF